MTDIGFIGLGAVAAGMVRCLLDAGHTVRVFVHGRPEGADALVAVGAVRSATLRDLVSASDVIITNVSDAGILDGIAVDILEGMRRELLWIDATTADPRSTRRLAERVDHAGGVFADAPTVGGPAMAEGGRLSSLVGCRREKFNRVKSIIGCYSSLVQRFGDPGAGHTAKLLNNFVAQGSAMLLVEAFCRARQAGVDWRALFDVMCTGPARSALLENMIGPVVDGYHEGAPFSIMNASKDIVYYRELCASVSDGDSVLADATLEMLKAAMDAGHGEDNVSSLLASQGVPFSQAG